MLSELLSTLALAGRICAGLVFALAALDKMRHWRVLEGVIGNYRLLPSFLVKPAAYILPPVELALAAALLSGMMVIPAAAAAMALLLLFALAMAINIHRGRDFIDCGCHQSFLRQTLKPALVVRNLALTGLLALSLSALPAAPAVAVGLAAGMAMFLFYLIANTVMALPVLGEAA